MTIGQTVRKALKELSDGILDMISPKDFRLTDDKPKRAKGYTEEHTQKWLDSVKKPKRARTKKGTYRADDKRTKEVNEAWEGGKAPKKRKNGKRKK